MKQAVLVSNNEYSNKPVKASKSHVIPLLELAKNQPAVIEAIIANPRFAILDDTVTQRLKDLGFLPNTVVRVVAKGLFGKPPYAVQLASGVQFSLRGDELKKISCRAL